MTDSHIHIDCIHIVTVMSFNDMHRDCFYMALQAADLGVQLY